MRTIKTQDLKDVVKGLCVEANLYLNNDVLSALQVSYGKEENPIAKDILNVLIENAALASQQKKPLCQDTGIGLFFIEAGQELSFQGEDLRAVIGQSMAEAYTEQPFRFSVTEDPCFDRKNSNNNLPPIIHWDIVSGDKLTITFMPKGGGAENMSSLKMFNPLSTLDEIKDFIVDTVISAGGKPCPPVIVGVGIGGSFDYAPYLAKKALLQPLDRKNADNQLSLVEADILARINLSNIGPMGLGGNTTALGVNIITHPCHIASLPVAVNLQCHSHRYKSITI